LTRLSADAYHDCGFRIAEVEVRTARHRAFDEQLWCGERLSNRRRDPRSVRRTGKRVQSVDVLSIGLEGLAACRQDVDLRCGHVEMRRQSCHFLNEVLASIEDQKNSLVPQIGDQTGRCIDRLNR
jgi:hypothetical protein